MIERVTPVDTTPGAPAPFGRQYAGLIRKDQYIMHRGEIVSVKGVTLYMPGSHPHSPLDNTMTAAALHTRNGIRWAGQHYVILVWTAEDADVWNRTLEGAVDALKVVVGTI